MPRSRDLDTVAPDDPVNSGNSSEKTAQPPQDAQPQENVPPASSSANPNIDQILGHTSSPFSAFLVHPKVFDFQERDAEERIILALRQHWFVNVSWVLITIVMAIFPIFFNTVQFLQLFTPPYRFIATLFWYLVTFAYAFEKLLGWYFNVYIVTTDRVVDIDFNNLLDKKFSEADLAVIQDVSSHVAGVSQTVFNYGTILIQTAAEIPEISFEKVPNPEKIVKVLQELRQEKINGGHHA